MNNKYSHINEKVLAVEGIGLSHCLTLTNRWATIPTLMLFTRDLSGVFGEVLILDPPSVNVNTCTELNVFITPIFLHSKLKKYYFIIL